VENRKRPSFQFYPLDWLGDPNVIAMTAEQRGAYIHILAAMWTTEDCSLPDDLGYLARLAQVDNGVIGGIYHCFNSVSGKLRHKRLDKERKKQDENRDLRSAAGKKGMEARWKAAPESQSDNTVITKNNLSSSSSTSTKHQQQPIAVVDNFSEEQKRMIVTLTRWFSVFDTMTYPEKSALNLVRKHDLKKIQAALDIENTTTPSSLSRFFGAFK